MARYNLALLLKALPHNIGVASLVILLLGHCSKGSVSLGTLSRLEKVDTLFDLVHWLVFGLFCAMSHCLVASGTLFGLGTISTISFGYIDHTPLLLCIRPLLYFIC